MKSLTEYIKESQQIDEVSISKKNRITKDAVNAVQGKKSSVKNPIKTIGIITSDYPDSDNIDYDNMTKAQRRHMNKRPAKDLRAYLKDMKLVYKDVKGKYNDRIENSVLVFNIPLDSLTALAKKYNQSSFIYIKITGDEVGDYFYYDKDDDYKKPKYEAHSVNTKDLGRDMFTRISKNFKFNIPFNFDECCQMMSNIICEGRAYRDGSDIDATIRRSMYGTPLTCWVKRSELYGSWLRQQEG